MINTSQYFKFCMFFSKEKGGGCPGKQKKDAPGIGCKTSANASEREGVGRVPRGMSISVKTARRTAS